MTDWETRYYEAEALHTEANGMLTAERDAMAKRYIAANLAATELRAYAELLRFAANEALTAIESDPDIEHGWPNTVALLREALAKNPNPAGPAVPAEASVSLAAEASGAGGAGTMCDNPKCDCRLGVLHPSRHETNSNLLRTIRDHPASNVADCTVGKTTLAKMIDDELRHQSGRNAPPGVVRICPGTDMACYKPPGECCAFESPDGTDWWAELRKIEDELRARGIKDIKFAWAPTAYSVPPKQVARDVVLFVRACLDGKYRPIDKIGDSAGLRHQVGRNATRAHFEDWWGEMGCPMFGPEGYRAALATWRTFCAPDDSQSVACNERAALEKLLDSLSCAAFEENEADEAKARAAILSLFERA